MALKVDAAAKTDIGRVRRNNEDSFGIARDPGLFVVCDGMGGAAGGEVASRLAVDTFLAIVQQEIQAIHTPAYCDGDEATVCALRRGVAAANRAVVHRAHWDMPLRGMGTTLVGARILEGKLFLINVGDSRAYLVRNGEATQLTHDHSYIAERVRLGVMAPDEAERSPMQSVITRAIGADDDVKPDLYEVILQDGDTILLTSDGLTRHVQTSEIASLLTSTLMLSAEEACCRLIDLAIQRGGHDNITCILLRVDDAGGQST